MKIVRTEKTIRLWLDEYHALFKHNDLESWHLEYYNFGKDYMPYDISQDKSILKLLRKFEDII